MLYGKILFRRQTRRKLQDPLSSEAAAATSREAWIVSQTPAPTPGGAHEPQTSPEPKEPAMDHIETAAAYGVTSTNPLTNPTAYHANFNPTETVDWADARLAKITRLRILGLGEYGCPVVDVSYCHGVLKDGSQVQVELGHRWQFPRRSWKSAIIDAAKADGVYAKGLGLFGAVDIM